MLIGIVIEAAVKSALILATLLGGFAYLTLLERRFLSAIQSRIGPNRVGPWGLFQPIADGLKLFFKEDIVPTNADKIVFAIAPALTAIPAFIILAVVPIGGTIQLGNLEIQLGLTNINVGVLYILAVTSISVYGIVLAGWSSANKYAMLGGLRSSAQMVSYELSMGLAIVVPILLSGSMSLNDIVDAPAQAWYAFLNPLSAAICMIAKATCGNVDTSLIRPTTTCSDFGFRGTVELGILTYLL